MLNFIAQPVIFSDDLSSIFVAGKGVVYVIDTTPSDNSEYLPTSNPFERVAKAGSAAADEMALMQHLIAQAKSGLIAQQTATNTDLPSNVPTPFPTLPLGGMGVAFAGLLQRNRYGGLNAVLNNSTMTQYDVAANATFTNGNLSSGNGWATQGSVTFTPSAFVTSDPSAGSGRTVDSFATLNEVTTTQTRLNQVFMVNANDRYLSFTLSGTALDNLTGTPDDAFEVALLNANPALSNGLFY
jgi:hypothetical protein